MADSDYSRHCTDYRNIPNDRAKKIRNAYGADDSYVVRLNLYERRRYEVIYYGGNFRGRGTIFNAIYANVVFGEVVHERQRKIFVV